MPRFISITFALFCFCFLSSAASHYDDIEIISSDEKTIQFTLNITDPLKYMVQSGGDSVFIAVKEILVGLPSNSFPYLINTRSQNPIPLALPDNMVIKPTEQTAVIEDIFSIRGRRVARINVYPYTGGRFYSQVDVELGFESSGREADVPGYYRQDKIFDAVYSYSILNYDQLKQWPVTSRQIVSTKQARSEFDLAAAWYKIKTSYEGMTKITGSDLIAAGIGIDGLRSDSIHVFYGGGEPLPPRNGISPPDFNEISLMVSDGGDGIIDRADYFLFFAEGTDRWRFPADSSPVYLENPYTNTNCYWLALSGDFGQGGLRMSTINGLPSGSADININTGWYYRHMGQNNLLYTDQNGRIQDYYHWYWSDERNLYIDEWMPNAIDAESSLVVMRAKSGPSPNLFVNNTAANRVSGSFSIYQFTSNAFNLGWNRLLVALDGSTALPTYLDYLQISYQGTLAPIGDVVDFSCGPLVGLGEITIINDFSATPVIFDLSNPRHPVNITGADISGSSITFQYNLDASGPNRFYVVSPGQARDPDLIEPANIIGLRANLSATDMYIIAPDLFLPHLEDYEDYREAMDDISVSRVSVEQIMDEFSYGLYDPVAIREFLKYAYDNLQPAPGIALLVGDGSHDFENNLNTATINYIPPYIHALDSSSSDDNYVIFGEYGLLDSDTTYPGNQGYDMMISRWPVRTLAEIETVVDKVKAYESSTSFGPWRTTITLVADDEFGAYSTEWRHTEQTEELQQTDRLPAAFRRNKVYLWDYPFDANREKPLVNEEIIRGINEGTLLVNYVGHGNPDTWAHEHVFNRNTDLPQLHNGEKMPLFLTASCSIGFFDSPLREGMAEDLIRQSGGGGIGVISATRLVYSEDNAAFNRQIFEILFGSDELSICQALFTAKILRQYRTGFPRPIRNDRNYTYFGDPLVKLQVPKYGIKITEYPDSLQALNRHYVAGEVINKSDSTRVDFDGSLDVYVFDSDINRNYKVVNDAGDSVQTVSYALNGPVIFRGNTDVTNGLFNFTFISPLDIGYGGQAAKISAYGTSTGADALGIIDSIPVSTDMVNVADSAGPVIEYSFGDMNDFQSGDKIRSGDLLRLTLIDSSGINLTESLGHGITLIVDDEVENMVNLTDLFEYNPGSFVTGEIEYNIGNLDQGMHQFRIKAWDNANNSSVAFFEADVLEGGSMIVENLLNYPNPMVDRTTFSFSLSFPARKVRLELFTLSGRLIRHFEETMVPSGYIEFCSWDGRDYEADRVATGIYIYKLTAVSDQTSEIVESFGKAIVIN
jgi:hypothetical protein